MQDNNQTDQFASNLKTFMKIYKSSDDLKDFIKNPTNSQESQKTVFKKILSQMNFNKILQNFFFILISKKRIFFLDKIIDEFLKLISNKNRISVYYFS